MVNLRGEALAGSLKESWLADCEVCADGSMVLVSLTDWLFPFGAGKIGPCGVRFGIGHPGKQCRQCCSKMPALAGNRQRLSCCHRLPRPKFLARPAKRLPDSSSPG